jgi:WD40 repeat protein
VNAVAWSTDGKIASGSTDRTVMIWNSSTGERLKTLEGHRLLHFAKRCKFSCSPPRGAEA